MAQQVILDPIDPGALEDVDHLVKAPAEYAHFVHYNWFRHDRAIGDPDIHYAWILNNERRSGAIAAAVRQLDQTLPAHSAVVVAQHPDNQVAASLHASLGFVPNGRRRAKHSEQQKI